MIYFLKLSVLKFKKKSLFTPNFLGVFLLYSIYLYKEVIIIYTVKSVDFFGESYCYIAKDMRKIILTKLSSCGLIVLDKLLELLDTDNEELIGTQAYRRIIYKNKSELARMFGFSKQYMQNGIDKVQYS